MTQRKCDICGTRAECKTYNKKQLLNKQKTHEYKQTGKQEDGTPILTKIIKWVTKGDANNKLIEELQQIHQFTRKTRLCQHCIKTFDLW